MATSPLPMPPPGGGALPQSGYIDPLTGMPVDPSMFIDPREYGGTRQEGERVGGGIGGDFLDWSKIPGMERFAEQLSASDQASSGRVYRYNDLMDEMARRGYRIYANDQSHQVTRGIVDAEGNFIGSPQTFALSGNDAGFLRSAAIMAGGAAYGAYGGAEASAGGAGSQAAADAVYAGADTAAVSTGGAAAPGGSLADAMAAAGDAGGFSGAGQPISTGAAPTGGASVPSLAPGAGNMTMTDWLTLGTMAYGAYQGDQARQGAEAAVGQAANDARAARDQMGAIAGRQLDLAERQYTDQQALLARLLPVFQQQMDLAIQQQQQSIQRGDQAWADYTATWRPVEQTLADRSMDMANPARIEQQAEQAGLRARGNFDTARTQMRRDMAAAGLSPDRIAAAEAASRLDEAKAVGGATDTARRGGESAAIGYLDNAARFGRNLPSQGLDTARLAGAQGSQAMGAAGAQQSAVAAPAQIVAPLLQGAAGTMGSSAQIGLQGAQIAQRGFNDSLAFYGDLIGAGASLWGMNSRPRGG